MKLIFDTAKGRERENEKVLYKLIEVCSRLLIKYSSRVVEGE